MIRPATLADIPTLVELGVLLHSTSSYAQSSYSRAKVAAHFQALIEGAGVIFVATVDDVVVGAIAGGVGQVWHSDDLYGFDWTFFVDPAHRHGLMAFKLVLAFEAWAKAKGAVELQLGITTCLGEEGTTRFYEWMGYEHRGRLFKKKVIHGH